MKKIVFGLIVLISSMSAFSYTECPINIQSIYAGDNGSIYITYENGGFFNIEPSDPNLKSALTLATAALMGGNQLVVRFSSNDVNCAAGKIGDFQGLFLLKK